MNIYLTWYTRHRITTTREISKSKHINRKEFQPPKTIILSGGFQQKWTESSDNSAVGLTRHNDTMTKGTLGITNDNDDDDAFKAYTVLVRLT